MYNDAKSMAWQRLSRYLDDSYEEFVYDKFEICFQYAPVDNWNTVIADLVVIMKKRERWNTNVNYKVRQVKSKFGRLCFYVDNSDDFLAGAIRMAEEQCNKLCFTCDSYDKQKIQTGSFLPKKCTACYDKAKQDEKI